MKNKIEGKIGRKAFGIGIFALVAALGLFFSLMMTERSVLADYEKSKVIVAKKTVPEGLLINSGNMNEYFEERETDSNTVPVNALKDTVLIDGMWSKCLVGTGTVVCDSMFSYKSEALNKLKDPVIAGIKAEDIYQLAGGMIRGGDSIRIYSIKDEDETKVNLLWDDVTVEKVFDSAGNIIDDSDQKTGAVRLNVYISAQDVEKLYENIGEGSVRIVKNEGGR